MARESWGGGGERGSSMAMSGRSTTSGHWWDRPGLPRPVERALGYLGTAFLIVLIVAWAWSIGNAKSGISFGGAASGRASMQTSVGMVASALTSLNAPTTAYLTDAALTMWANRLVNQERGASGKLQVLIEKAPSPVQPESLPPGGRLRYGQ